MSEVSQALANAGRLTPRERPEGNFLQRFGQDAVDVVKALPRGVFEIARAPVGDIVNVGEGIGNLFQGESFGEAFDDQGGVQTLNLAKDIGLSVLDTVDLVGDVTLVSNMLMGRGWDESWRQASERFQAISDRPVSQIVEHVGNLALVGGVVAKTASAGAIAANKVGQAGAAQRLTSLAEKSNVVAHPYRFLYDKSARGVQIGTKRLERYIEDDPELSKHFGYHIRQFRQIKANAQVNLMKAGNRLKRHNPETVPISMLMDLKLLNQIADDPKRLEHYGIQSGSRQALAIQQMAENLSANHDLPSLATSLGNILRGRASGRSRVNLVDSAEIDALTIDIWKEMNEAFIDFLDDSGSPSYTNNFILKNLLPSIDPTAFALHTLRTVERINGIPEGALQGVGVNVISLGADFANLVEQLQKYAKQADVELPIGFLEEFVGAKELLNDYGHTILGTYTAFNGAGKKRKQVTSEAELGGEVGYAFTASLDVLFAHAEQALSEVYGMPLEGKLPVTDSQGIPQKKYARGGSSVPLSRGEYRTRVNPLVDEAKGRAVGNALDDVGINFEKVRNAEQLEHTIKQQMEVLTKQIRTLIDGADKLEDLKQFLAEQTGFDPESTNVTIADAVRTMYQSDPMTQLEFVRKVALFHEQMGKSLKPSRRSLWKGVPERKELLNIGNRLLKDFAHEVGGDSYWIERYRHHIELISDAIETSNKNIDNRASVIESALKRYKHLMAAERHWIHGKKTDAEYQKLIDSTQKELEQYYDLLDFDMKTGFQGLVPDTPMWQVLESTDYALRSLFGYGEDGAMVPTNFHDWWTDKAISLGDTLNKQGARLLDESTRAQAKALDYKEKVRTAYREYQAAIQTLESDPNFANLEYQKAQEFVNNQAQMLSALDEIQAKLAQKGLSEAGIDALRKDIERLPQTLDEIDQFYQKVAKTRNAQPTFLANPLDERIPPQNLRARIASGDIQAVEAFVAKEMFKEMLERGIALSDDDIINAIEVAHLEGRLADTGTINDELTQAQLNAAANELGYTRLHFTEIPGVKSDFGKIALEQEFYVPDEVTKYVWVKKEVKKSMHNTSRILNSENAIGRAIQNGLFVYDNLTQAFKFSVLAFRPAWHINNIIGNMFMASMSGVSFRETDGAMKRLAYEVAKQNKHNTLTSEWSRTIKVPISPKTARKWEQKFEEMWNAPDTVGGQARRMLAPVRIMGGAEGPHYLALKKDFINEIIENPTFNELAKEGTAQAHMAGLSPEFQALLTDRIPPDTWLSQKFNAARQRIDSSEQSGSRIVRGVGKVAQKIEGSAEILNDVGKASFRLNGFVDTAFRALVAIDGVMNKGMKNHEAITHTLKALGDYNSLTPFEKSILTRIFPFYPWMRHIAAFSGRMLKPDNISRTLIFTNLANAAGQPNQYEQMLPEWAAGDIYVGLDEKTGQHKFLATRGANPLLDTVDMLPDFKPGEGFVGGTIAPLIRSANPMIQIGLESATGVSTLTRRPFSAPYPVLDENNREVLQRPSLGRQIGETIPWFQAGIDLTSAVTGQPTARYGTGDRVPGTEPEPFRRTAANLGYNVRKFDLERLRQQELLANYRTERAKRRYQSRLEASRE